MSHVKACGCKVIGFLTVLCRHHKWEAIDRQHAEDSLYQSVARWLDSKEREHTHHKRED